MHNLIGDRFLKHFLRRVKNRPCPDSASDGQTPADGGAEGDEVQEKGNSAAVKKDGEQVQQNNERGE